jgi:hypothetical protein
MVGHGCGDGQDFGGSLMVSEGIGAAADRDPEEGEFIHFHLSGMKI